MIIKIKYQSAQGISGKSRLFVEFFIAFIFIYLLQQHISLDLWLINIPYFKDLSIDVGIFTSFLAL